MISKAEMSQKLNCLKENEKFWIVATFVLTLLLKIASNLHSVNIDLIKDEIGYLALPATLAGLNWNSVIQQSSYYGFGYIVLFTPLFRWVDNPYVIWAVIRLVNILGISALSVGLFYLQKKVFKKNDSLWNCVVAVFICQFASIGWDQEFSIFVSVWIAVCVFWSAYSSSGKKKAGMSILLAFWVCYSMTLHERNMVLAMAVIIMVLFYAIVFRQKIVSFLAFVPSFIVFYNIQEHIKQCVVERLYPIAQNGETVANTEVFTGDMLWFLDDIYGSLKIMLNIVLANIYTLINQTYGMAILAFVILIYQLIRLFKKESRQKEENNPVLFFLLFSFLTTAIMIAGLAVKWGRGISIGDSYSYKAMTYYRYFGAYIWPAVFCFLLSKENKKLWVYVVSVIGYIGTYLCMRGYIIEQFIHASNTSQSRISLINAWVPWVSNIPDPYKAAIVSGACVLAIGIILWKIDHKKILIVWLSCMMISALSRVEVPLFTCYVADGTYKAYTKLAEEVPDVIYVDPMAYDMWYTLQYMLLDTEVLLYKPSGTEEFIYFSRSRDPAITAEGTRILDLNVYEHLYVFGDELQESFRQAGYEFERTYEESGSWLLDELNIDDNVNIIVEADSELEEILTAEGYNVSSENMFENKDQTNIVFSRYLMTSVDALYAEGYYVYEMSSGYVMANDKDLFIEIETAYLNDLLKKQNN